MSDPKTAHPLVECQLCPKACKLAYLERGDCRVRYNAGKGVLKTMVYGKPCSVHVDPIEKKPMFHFLPGSPIFSIATAGCNLHCLYCQNWEISQADPEDVRSYDMPPKKVVQAAKNQGCMSIAYTYTDPIIYYEYAFDTCVIAKEAGLNNILVTAGYINEKPLKQWLPFVDGANVDLKNFDPKGHKETTSGDVRHVLRTLEIMAEAGIVLEITNLVVPGLNDDTKIISDMCRWIATNLGSDVPLHFSRFWPKHKMKHLPPTPEQTLLKAATIAKDSGLRYVYIGNLRSGEHEHTYCPSCHKAVIKRKGFQILEYHLTGQHCSFCNSPLWGRWWPEKQWPPNVKKEKQ